MTIWRLGSEQNVKDIPDTNDVEPAQAANAYLFLKSNFDVNRV